MNMKQLLSSKMYHQLDIRKSQDMSPHRPESTEKGLLRESQRDGNGAFGGTSRKLLLLTQDWEEIGVSATI